MRAKDPRLVELEAGLVKLARKLKLELPESVGFALFLFDYGQSGFMTYTSTGKREDVVNLVIEWLDKMEYTSGQVNSIRRAIRKFRSSEIEPT